jgi:hypothetical protein
LSEYRPIEGVKVIGFGHKARHGKDTAARVIVSESRGRAMRFSFADDLYAHCRIAHGMTVEGRAVAAARRGPSMTATKDPDVWLRAACTTKLLDDAPGRSLIISDVRFPNEGDFVRALGGTSWSRSPALAGGRVAVRGSRRGIRHASEARRRWTAWAVGPDVIRHRDGPIRRFSGRWRAGRSSQHDRGRTRSSRQVYVAGPYPRRRRRSSPARRTCSRVQENVMRAMALALEVWRLGAVAV